MKKILSVLLSVCLLCTLSTMLVSCMHKCEFSEEWSKDDTSHWHACVGEECTEIADKADHVWNEGVITTKATQEAEGVKTFTCTVCQHTKTEPVEFTGLSKEDWNTIISSASFENFKYTESSKTSGNGMTIDSETIYKFTKTSAWVKITIANQSNESYAPSTADANEVRKQLIDSIKDIAPYDSFEYDAETKSYKATKSIKIAALNASTSDITIKFSDGKLAEIKYNISYTQNGTKISVISTITISDYGTVVLP